MWTLIWYGVTALSGWVVSDIFNETKDAAKPVEAAGDTVKKHWVKWVVIAAGSALFVFLIARSIRVFLPKTDLLKNRK